MSDSSKAFVEFWRHRIAHGYEETDFEMVWDTVKTYVPELVGKLRDKGL